MFRSCLWPWYSVLPLSSKHTAKAYTFFAEIAITQSRRILTIFRQTAKALGKPVHAKSLRPQEQPVPSAVSLPRIFYCGRARSGLYSLCRSIRLEPSQNPGDFGGIRRNSPLQIRSVRHGVIMTGDFYSRFSGKATGSLGRVNLVGFAFRKSRPPR